MGIVEMLNVEEKISNLKKIASFLEVDENSYSYYGTNHPHLEEIYSLIEVCENSPVVDFHSRLRVAYFLDEYKQFLVSNDEFTIHYNNGVIAALNGLRFELIELLIFCSEEYLRAIEVKLRTNNYKEFITVLGAVEINRRNLVDFLVNHTLYKDDVSDFLVCKNSNNPTDNEKLEALRKAFINNY